jgi:hypothetical protein
MEEPYKLQTTLWRMRFAYCMTKATGTFSEYATPVFSDGKDGYANAPQCYFIRTLRVLLWNLTSSHRG